MACTSILRIGGPLGSETSISILKTELSNHFEKKDEEDCFHIANKYFTARIQFAPFDNGGGESVQVEDTEDGIILVFPSSTHIETLTECHDTLPNAGDTLRLCISTSVNTINMTKEYEEQYSQRVLWCLDRGYEYIEVDLREEGLKSGFDEREKDGFARVVEAMGGTVWSSAVMAKRNTRTASKISVVEEKHDDELDDCKEIIVVDEQEKTDEPKTEKITQDIHIGSVQDSDEKKDELASDTLDSIEQVMKEAKRIRESSKGGELSDQDRKQRAGDAAEMLMGLLDQMGFDDDDDDEAEADSSDEE